MNKENKFILAEYITKGEISIIVIAFVVWTLLAVVFNNMIKNHTLKANEKYYKAIQIDNDESLFEYAVRTDSGNALVHGNLSAVDTVTIPEITGEYLAVRIEIEKYVQKSKIVEKKDNNGKTIRKKKTWEEWEYYSSSTKTSNDVEFLGIEFPYSKFNIGCFEAVELSENISPEYSEKVKWGKLYEGSTFFERIGDLRYTFFVIPKTKEVTIFTKLKDKNIYDVKVHYKTIPEVMEGIEKYKNVPNIIFTILWYVLFVGGAYYFAMQRNAWIDF